MVLAYLTKDYATKFETVLKDSFDLVNILETTTFPDDIYGHYGHLIPLYKHAKGPCIGTLDRTVHQTIP